MCSIKKNGQIDADILFWEGEILFGKNHYYLNLKKKQQKKPTFSETDIVKILQIWLITSLLCLVDIFVNRQYTVASQEKPKESSKSHTLISCSVI